MPTNPYDQACRYIVRVDPLGSLRWVFPRLPVGMRFLGWLDTRNIPFPGEPDRTSDTVACLEDEANPGPLWALPLEFQSKPALDMFGRWLEYLGNMWRQKRPLNRPGEHYGVIACLVNLTGQGDSSRDYILGDARTLLQPCECNVATRDAVDILPAIAGGEITRAILPFIPLMKNGSELGIIKQWLEVARTEPNERNRGDFGGLALVFAELAGCRPVWKQALQGWNMQVSQQVLEWQAEGEARGALRARREDLRTLLLDRFGVLPESLVQRIEAAEDMERLQAALRQVYKIQTPDELCL